MAWKRISSSSDGELYRCPVPGGYLYATKLDGGQPTFVPVNLGENKGGVGFVKSAEIVFLSKEEFESSLPEITVSPFFVGLDQNQELDLTPVVYPVSFADKEEWRKFVRRVDCLGVIVRKDSERLIVVWEGKFLFLPPKYVRIVADETMGPGPTPSHPGRC